MQQITATKNKVESDEKRQVWDLSNGWKLTIEYCEASRIDHITRLEKGNELWHCSMGPEKMPDFAKGWDAELAEAQSFRQLVEKCRW